MNLALEITEKVADLEQTSPFDLPPLNDSIDVDSLEKCVDSAGERATFQFGYCYYRITVQGDGMVLIETKETSMGSDSQ